MATSAITPPPGFELEQAQGQGITPPPGFELETQGAAPEPSIPKITRSTNPKLNIAASGENMPEYVGATGALGAGAMGATALGEAPLIGGAARWLGRKISPYFGPAIGSYAINKAKQLPVVGPVIQKIPFAETIPWLVGGGGKHEPEAEPTYPGAPEPSARPEQLNPALASESRTLPGMIGKEVIRSTPSPIARPEPIPPRRGLVLPPGPEGIASPSPRTTPTGRPLTPQELAVQAHSGTPGISPTIGEWQPPPELGVSSVGNIEERIAANRNKMGPLPRSTPAAEPAYIGGGGSLLEQRSAPGPIAGSRADLAETKGIQERMREMRDLENTKNLRLAREENGRLPTKGELTGEVNKPVTLTKTPAKSRIAAPTASAARSVGTPAASDLTPEWQKALDEVKAWKGKGGS